MGLIRQNFSHQTFVLYGIVQSIIENNVTKKILVLQKFLQKMYLLLDGA